MLCPQILISLILTLTLWLPPFSASATEPGSAGALPGTILWAWQRSEDLTSINPETTGVAYWAANALLEGPQIKLLRRNQPLKVPPTTRLLAVIRVDSSRRNPPTLDATQAKLFAQKVVAFASLPQTLGLQIDFDATLKERTFYRQVLNELRTLLPPDKLLSITALASWCLFDDWMTNLPVQETVPMMFSLGRDRSKVLLHFKSGRDFFNRSCCRSLGVSLEDTEVNKLMIPLAQKRKIPVRIYVFTRTSWTKEKLESLAPFYR